MNNVYTVNNNIFEFISFKYKFHSYVNQLQSLYMYILFVIIYQNYFLKLILFSPFQHLI